jgi:predicted nucleic acid-binding protein
LKIYLDTSVMLGWLLEGRKELALIPMDSEVASSRLLWIETIRSLDRAVRSRQLSDGDGAFARIAFEQMSQGITRLSLTEAIQDRASQGFPTIIRTLDALHLSSAMAWSAGQEIRTIEIWSFDRQMNLCAQALGFSVRFAA